MPWGERYCAPGDENGMVLKEDITAKPIYQVDRGTFEGPVWVEDLQSLLFCDLRKVVKLQRKGNNGATVSNFTNSSPCAGLAINEDESALYLTQGFGANNPQLGYTTFADVKVTKLADRVGNQRFERPNDVAYRTADGSAYLTDPLAMAIFRVTPDGTATKAVNMNPIGRPNGITFSLDEKTLYVAGDRNPNGKVWAFPVADDGSLGQPTILIDKGLGNADGMAIDCAGNLYVASSSGRVLKIFDSQGNVLGSITSTLARAKVSNPAFGGPDRKTLFFTSNSGEIYAVDLDIVGLPY